jgi:hypothetical protein
MGQPVPGYMDGRVLEEAIDGGLAAAHRPVRQSAESAGGGASKVGYSDDDKREMEEKLKGLGYL